MKKYRSLFPVVVLVIILLLFVPAKRDLEQSYTCCVLDQQDENYRGEVVVTFSGTYTDHLVFKDKFVGRLDIEGYEFLDPDASDCTFYIRNYEENWIHEYIDNLTEFESNYPGTFYATEDLDSFFIWVNVPSDPEKGYSGGFYGRYFITYPEITFDEIYSILDKNNA